ncbi:hypothetical protein [Sporosarcina sp. P7]|uniref:hypothetical protein n=1 Tax=Sporosarcina sp. P7 TaxID=2048244 RepID=UPI000C16A676|nr:hypothetical protein [Sporosarcina sp. P7]PID23335.1 hypothetical protein CSV60_15370 [Sporosarcina sp. P7]
MFKKRFYVGSALAILLLAGCGNDEVKEEKSDTAQSGEESSAEEKGKMLAAEDFDKMYSNPKNYKNYGVNYIGKVMNVPEKDDDGIYLQVYAKPENYEQNTVVFYPDASLSVSDEDYVKITGVVRDQFKGENMMGAELTMPMIEATELEVISYTDAMAPTLRTIEVNETKEQHGYEMTVEKIELSEKQTRIFFTIKNNSSEKISFYSFNSKLVAGGKQLETEDDYESDLKEPQSDILPGTSTSGVVLYPPLGEEISEIQVYAEGSSENYEHSIEPFMFDVNLQP